MSDEAIDFLERRKKNIESKKRQFERVVFQDFMGTYTVVDEAGTGYPIELVDISYTGCQFQVPARDANSPQFEEGKEVNLKLYFTKFSYIPVVLTIKRQSEHRDQQNREWIRIGGEFDETVPSFQALKSFIDFIYQYAEFSVIDKGESKVYFL
jgi:hypothetical protein